MEQYQPEFIYPAGNGAPPMEYSQEPQQGGKRMRSDYEELSPLPRNGGAFDGRRSLLERSLSPFDDRDARGPSGNYGPARGGGPEPGRFGYGGDSLATGRGYEPAAVGDYGMAGRYDDLEPPGYPGPRGFDRGLERALDRGPERGYDRGLDRGSRGVDRGERGYDRGPYRDVDRSFERYPDRYPDRELVPDRRGYASGPAVVSRGGSAVELPRDASQTLFVDGLPPDCTKREAAHIFRPFPGYRDVRIVLKDARKRPGEKLALCFVEFEDARYAATALDALQGYKFDEHDPDSAPLRIVFARNTQPRSRDRDAPSRYGPGESRDYPHRRSSEPSDGRGR